MLGNTSTSSSSLHLLLLSSSHPSPASVHHSCVTSSCFVNNNSCLHTKGCPHKGRFRQTTLKLNWVDAVRVRVPSRTGPESCVAFLRLLRFPPTLQRHAGKVNWQLLGFWFQIIYFVNLKSYPLTKFWLHPHTSLKPSCWSGGVTADSTCWEKLQDKINQQSPKLFI